MRLPQDPRLPELSAPGFKTQLYQLFRDTAKQVNSLSEGHIQAVTNADTTAPTTGTYQQGDKVWNSTPTELGGGGAKYVILGWVCTSAGTPGTWLQMRTLTGN